MLEETLDLAQQAARTADSGLAEEAERLMALCVNLLQHAGAPAAEEAALCPGYSRPINPSALRCRACGTLFV